MTLLWVVALAWAGPAEAWLAAPEDATARLAFAVELATAPATHVEGLVALERLTSDAGVGCAAQTALVRAGPPRWVESGAACPATSRGPAGGAQRYADLSPDESVRRLHVDLLNAADVATWDALADELGGAWGRAAEAAKAGANGTLGEAEPPTASWPPDGARLHAVARRDWLVAVALRPQVGPDYGGLGGVLWDELRLAEAWAWFEAGARRAPYDRALAGALVDLVAYAGLPTDLVVARTGLPADAAEALPDAVRRLREEAVDPGLIARTILAPPGAASPADDDIAELARVLFRSVLPYVRWRWEWYAWGHMRPAEDEYDAVDEFADTVLAIPGLGSDPRVQAALNVKEPVCRWSLGFTPRPTVPGQSTPDRRLGFFDDAFPRGADGAYSSLNEVIRGCGRLRRVWPDDRTSRTVCADVQLRWGFGALLEGDLELAQLRLDQAVADSPLARDELWRRVDPEFVSWMAAGDLSSAAALITPFFTPGLTAAPLVADRMGWLHLVRAQRYDQDDATRVADYEAALATHPAPALIGLHGLYARHGDVDMAIACLVELLELPFDERDPVSTDDARELLVVYLARVWRPVDARLFAWNNALRIRMNEELAWASLVGDARRAHGGPIHPALIRRLETADASTLDRLALRGGAWLDIGQLDRAWADLSRVAAEGGDPAGAIATARLLGLDKVTLPVDPNGDVTFLRQLEGVDAAPLKALNAPQSPQRLVWVGDALARLGDVDHARGAYEAALAVEPELFDAQIGLARLAAADGPPWEVEQHLRSGFNRTHHPAYALALSDLLISLGRVEDARAVRAELPDTVEVADPRVPLLPRVTLPSGRAPLLPAPFRLTPLPSGLYNCYELGFHKHLFNKLPY